MKRSLASGYAGVQNPLFFKDNSRMFFGDAKDSLDNVLKEITK
jgi:NAD(P) transhydrogenase subunit beta